MRKVSLVLAPRSLVTMSMLTLFSCSIPFFGKGRGGVVEDSSKKLATVSGVLEYKEGCVAGYYKVMLKGLFENAGIQIETQSDSTGRFSFTAPPGKYIAQVVKDQCGMKETVELEKNTEHMYTFSVKESDEEEKVMEFNPQSISRLPASVLIAPSK